MRLRSSKYWFEEIRLDPGGNRKAFWTFHLRSDLMKVDFKKLI